ncbi:MAG: bifunctional phosphoribosylaminoimidazolecarboxamide formyltransferase/IMP cyclohydrolase [Planctomycetia bacterium]|nr:bifunctional phosphoribosylaminoimidazolecarboxamide formyltransferase/IMP cyclohydrolase [Planctomycetia bacterium]
MSLRPVRRVLISVSDKTGVVDLARVLDSYGAELISTGHTRKALQDAGLKALDISEVTGFPEMLSGRVKTLHPRVHGGILALRDNPQHQATLKEHDIKQIDMVVCNLYPFRATVARQGSTHEEIIENIDIGGPTLIRAAAKNYKDVAVVTDPDQYRTIVQELRDNQGALTLDTRHQLAADAYSLTAAYDSAVTAYFVHQLEKEDHGALIGRWLGGSGLHHHGGELPSNLSLYMERRMALRYGENPHQQAAFYVDPAWQFPGISTAEPLHGKELSFNNLLDLDSAFNLVREFSQPACAIIKHNNPCGAAVGLDLELAFKDAQQADPISAYGGIVACNRPIEADTARALTEPNQFFECIIAPEFSDEAFEILTTRPTWKKSIRLLRTGELPADDKRAHTLDVRRVDGGFLVQTRDLGGDDFAKLQIVSKKQPTDEQLADLRFAWLVCKHVKSNAIVLAQDGKVTGVGAGQMSRVDSVHMATRKAGDKAKGSVLASDAFFPFRDNIDLAAAAGVTAIIQPGGSMRDKDSIEACDEHGLAMVLTGVRHFRH